MLDLMRNVLTRLGIEAPDLHPLYSERPDGVGVFAVAGSEAVGTWRALVQLAPETGVWPLLSGDPADEPILSEQLEASEDDPAAVISQAEVFDLAAWEDGQRDGNDLPPVKGWPLLAFRRRGPGFVTHLGVMTRRPLARANMLLVAAKKNWHIPAVLGYGGWNDCPFPHEHCALARLWNRDYAASVVGATHDTLEFHVARPPADKAACLELARLHYLYCSEIGEELGKYASTLLGNETWAFWWD